MPSAIPTIYNHGIQITKPWSSEMYAFNDSLFNDYREKILEAIHEVDNFNTLNDLASIINPSRYGEGFDLESARKDLLRNFDYAENYWMHETIPDLIKDAWIQPIIFCTDSKEHNWQDGMIMNLIGFESREEILKLREIYSSN